MKYDITANRYLGIDDKTIMRRIVAIADVEAKKNGIQVLYSSSTLAELRATGLKHGTVQANNGTVTVKIALTWIGKPFRKKIEREIERLLDRV